MKRLRRVDRVVHLAAVTSVQKSIRDPVFTTEVNVVGTLNVLEVAKALKAERVVFASSAAVYGTPRAFPISEEASLSRSHPMELKGGVGTITLDHSRRIMESKPFH